MFPWGLLGQGLKAGLDIYKNKKASEVAMSEAALLHAEKMKRGEIEYTGKVFENQKNDWKDEFILLTLSSPKTAAWQRKEGKDPKGGLNRKGIASYRRANPGSKLSMAVTTKPSKLKKGSKAANRRKSFCARMSGMKKRLTSAKTANDPNSRINKSLRKWNC
jgi:hypothetical protein